MLSAPMRICGFWLVLAALGLPGLQQANAAEKYALVVAVNDYPQLGDSATLRGPTNDAESIVAYLESLSGPGFSPQRITVLANGPYQSADGVPDRATIMEAMRRLATDAKDGDFVYLHFGGHGSQQKAISDRSEPDGRDEVFLPADTGRPEDGIYPNALIDDEIGALIGAIRDGGAFVFVVFDACQSSSATRTVDGAGQERQRWLPEPPGIGETQPTGDAAPKPWLEGSDLGERSDRGGMVAFFAAQTVEPTPEMPLPFQPAGGRVHGLFSFAILEALTRNPGISYRQLAESVLTFYAVSSRSRPTPLFEGDLDHIVFGGDESSRVLQWPVTPAGGVVRLPAGTLHGLAAGDMLAILPHPAEATENAIGYVRIVSLKTLEADAYPVAYRDYPALNPAAIPAGSFARPLEFPVALDLSIRLEASPRSDFAGANAIARDAVGSIAANKALPLNLKITNAGDATSFRLLVASESDLYPGSKAEDLPRLWFLPADGQIPVDQRMKPHSIGLDGGLDEMRRAQLKLNLAAMFRATSLSRLASIPSSGTAPNVRFVLQDGQSELLSITSPRLKVGSIIDIKIENSSHNPLDVDVLLIGADYSIQHLMGERFQPGASLKSPIIRVAGNAPGTRRIIVIAREQPLNAPQADLSFLKQVGLRTRSPNDGKERSAEGIVTQLAHSPLSSARVRYDPTSKLKSSIRSYAFSNLP